MNGTHFIRTQILVIRIDKVRVSLFVFSSCVSNMTVFCLIPSVCLLAASYVHRSRRTNLTRFCIFRFASHDVAHKFMCCTSKITYIQHSKRHPSPRICFFVPRRTETRRFNSVSFGSYAFLFFFFTFFGLRNVSQGNLYCFFFAWLHMYLIRNDCAPLHHDTHTHTHIHDPPM